MSFAMSDMQKEFWRECQKGRKWNIKCGATRSGKTYLDYFVIAMRIRACKGKGLIVLLGNTKSTLQRNILDPMRDIYGSKMISEVSSDNTARIFGKKVYCLGADKVNQVSKIQGAAIEYAYGDEVTTWHREVFEMLKSRLSFDNSVFDGTCNPEGPNHWFRTFLLSDADIFQQQYTIDDNPFLPPKFVAELKKEYAGTVYYDRYINGKWTRAEGLLFPQFASDPGRWDISYEDALRLPISRVLIGLDVGGTKSHTAFVATGIVGNYQRQVRLYEKILKHSKGTVDPDKIYDTYNEFQQELKMYYPDFPVTHCFVDNEAQAIENGLRAYSLQHNYQTKIEDCKKMAFTDRTLSYNFILNTDKFMIVTAMCPKIVESLSTMVYADEKEDKLLDDYSTDVDTYDADFYSWSRYMEYFYTRARYTGR